LKPEPEPEMPEPVYGPEPSRDPVFSVSSFTYTPPGPAGTPNESEEDRKERLVLISKIKKYKKEFQFVNEISFNEAAPIHQLRNTLDEIRGLIQGKTTNVLIKRTYITGVSTLELLGQKTKLAKLNGLTDILSRSAEVESILKEISCEMHIGYVSPFKKLAFITLSSAYVLHTMNAKSEVFETFGKEQTNPEVINQYSDL
jgi:hypothetical protein